MKKIGFLLFVLWYLSVPALAGDVTVKLQVLQSSLVLGEPLSVVITVENTSQSALDLPFEPILAGMNPAVLVGTPGGEALTSSHGAPLACEEAYTNITASFPWKMGKDFDITVPAGKSVEFHSRLWLPISLRTKPGIYTLTPHYVARGTHPGQLGAVIGGPAPHPARQVGQGCWKGTVDGTAVQISLNAPTGIDAQAYQAFKGHPLKHPAELLKRFPTSTYAGYALLRKVPDYSNPLFKPVPPQQQVRMSRDEGKTVVTFSNKAFEKFFKQLDAFMQGGRVPESLRTRLYGFYGDLLVQRGRFQEAEEAFKKAVLSKPQNEEGKAYFKRAQAFLTALKAKSPRRKIEKGKD